MRSATGVPRRAVRVERSAHQEAVAHLGKSLELLRRLPETEERDRLELRIQISLGSAFVVIGGYASPRPDRERPAKRAHELSREARRASGAVHGDLGSVDEPTRSACR